VTFREFARRVGANVRRARYAAALTQEDAADRTLTLRVFSQLEGGRGNPTLRALFALAKRLDVSVAELVAVVEDAESDRVPLDARELRPPKRGRKPKPVRRQ
jgi:transcriptional regulator with XRE-family HTH domain